MHVNETKVNPVSFGHYLGEAGYTVGYFGKHLNNCPKTPPPGFDCPTCYWFAYGGDTVPGHGKGGGYVDSAFYDYCGGVAVNGTAYHPVPGIYQADTKGEYAGYSASIVANKSIAWVKKVAAEGKPFIVTIGNRASHAPFTPPPWYAEGMPASRWIDNLKAPRTPDYNASCPGFHWLVAHQPPLTDKEAAETDGVFRNRWRALMAVDDGIAGMVQTINELGVENNTYFFVTSDHGWNLGQHRLPGGKHNVYDHSTRIPMVMKGPGIAPGSSFDHPASQVDIAPTLLGLAGADELSAHMDGKSIAHLIIDPSDPHVSPSARAHVLRTQARLVAKGESPSAWRTFHPIEFWALNNHTWFDHLIDDVASNSYRALRFVNDPIYGDLLYAEFTAVTDWHYELPECPQPWGTQGGCRMFEMFNMSTDPASLKNIYMTASAELKAGLQKRLIAHWNCSGTTCL